MSIRIYTDNSIELNGEMTCFKVSQDSDKTTVYTSTISTGYKEYEMPEKRYSLAHDLPLSGIPGRIKFEQDLIKLMQ